MSGVSKEGVHWDPISTKDKTNVSSLVLILQISFVE